MAGRSARRYTTTPRRQGHGSKAPAGGRDSASARSTAGGKCPAARNKRLDIGGVRRGGRGGGVELASIRASASSVPGQGYLRDGEARRHRISVCSRSSARDACPNVPVPMPTAGSTAMAEILGCRRRARRPRNGSWKSTPYGIASVSAFTGVARTALQNQPPPSDTAFIQKAQGFDEPAVWIQGNVDVLFARRRW